MRWSALIVAVLPAFCIAQTSYGAVETITTSGTTWTASTWGYNTPKLLYDGHKLYAVALVGRGPKKDVARLFWRDAFGWRQGADLAPVYQPATILLDAEGHINVFCTNSGERGLHWRSKRPGDVREFEEIALPDAAKFGYGYLGVGRRQNLLALAGLDNQYRMWITTKASADTPWRAPALLADSLLGPPPRRSPVYPVVLPDEHGVHVVYSNSPDGSTHNTYNRVEYAFFDPAKGRVARHETIVEGPIGEMTYGLDALNDPDGGVSVIYFAGIPVYGPPQTDQQARRGIYFAHRDPAGGWTVHRVTASTGTAQLHRDGDGALSIFESTSAGYFRHRSSDGGKSWKRDASVAWDGGAFLYLIKPNSGSSPDPAVRGVQSRLLPAPNRLGVRYVLEYVELSQ